MVMSLRQRISTSHGVLGYRGGRRAAVVGMGWGGGLGERGGRVRTGGRGEVGLKR